MKVNYRVKKNDTQHEKLKMVWGCYAGCCENVDRGIDY